MDIQHPGDLSRQSEVKKYPFGNKILEIEVSCYNWSEKIILTKGWQDNLAFGMNSKKFSDWLLNK